MEKIDPLHGSHRVMSNGSASGKADGRMPLQQNDQAINQTSARLGEPESPSKRDKLLSLPSKTKAKTKVLLTKIKDDSPRIAKRDEEEDGIDEALNRRETLGLPESPGHKSTARKISDKTKNSLHSAASAVAHPRQTVKNKVTRTAASKISTVQRSRPSRSANVELLEAYDSLSRVESSKSSRHATSDDETEEIDTTAHRERIANLEAARESARVAWATSHVRRVRVVPKGEVKLPKTDEFLKDAQKKSMSNVNWLEWLGHVSSRNGLDMALLTTYHRCCSTTRRTLALNTLMILTGCHTTSIPSRFISRGPSWPVLRGKGGY